MAKNKPINPYVRLRTNANAEIRKFKGRERIPAFNWENQSMLFTQSRTAKALGYELHIEPNQETNTVDIVFYKKVELYYL